MYGPHHGTFTVLVKTTDFSPTSETAIYTHTDGDSDIWWSKEFDIGHTNNFQVFTLQGGVTC